MPPVELDGKTVLVTGAARRVGRAIAETLAEAGARVVIHHAHSPREAESLALTLEEALVVQADLREPEAAERLVDAARAHGRGRLDALVSSAADFQRTPLAELTDEKWEAMLALNLTAPMRLARAAVPAGVRAIVNIVDVAAWQPWANWSAYATSKAALLHLSRCLALELAPATRVNCVAPGTVIFPDDWDEARRRQQLAKVPLARAGSPADVARAVRYLCQEEYVTGACIPVDGGAGLR